MLNKIESRMICTATNQKKKNGNPHRNLRKFKGKKGENLQEISLRSLHLHHQLRQGGSRRCRKKSDGNPPAYETAAWEMRAGGDAREVAGSAAPSGSKLALDRHQTSKILNLAS